MTHYIEKMRINHGNSNGKKEAGQMRTLYARMANFAILSVLLPFVYGCQGGGGALGFLGGSGGGSGGSFVGGGDIGGGGITTIVQPEPTTMLLLGSGMAAMAAYKRKRK